MSKFLFNSLPNFNSISANVDKENGIIRGACVAQQGKNKNDSYFDDNFLNDIVAHGNQADGVKARFGHPNMCATSLGTFIGRYRNFEYREYGTEGKKAVFADLHLDPITKKTNVEGKGITMFDYIVEMAATNPDMFGNSIVIYSETFQQEIDGKLEWLHKLDKFKACDLVDDPAATDALFSADNKDLGVVVTQFLDQNPQIFQTIQKQPAIIQDFFERYANYSNRKSVINFNMSFLERIKNKLQGKKDDAFDIDITLADGSIVTVVTEATEPQVGDSVTDDSGSPVPDGDHVTTDGGTITTVDGVITAITPAADTPPAGEPTLTEVMNSVNSLQNAVNALTKNFGAFQKESESAIDLLSDKVFELGKNVKSKYQVPPADTPPTTRRTSGEKGVYDPEKAAEIRKNRK